MIFIMVWLEGAWRGSYVLLLFVPRTSEGFWILGWDLQLVPCSVLPWTLLTVPKRVV